MILEELSKNKKHIIITRESVYGQVRKNIQNKRVPFIDMGTFLEELQKKEGEDILYFKVTKVKGHWNYEGHKIIADFLTEQLKPYMP